MRGTILGFTDSEGRGVITAADGSRVPFSRSEWKGTGAPIAGRSVDYDLRGDEAAEIYTVPGSGGFDIGSDAPEDRSKLFGALSLGLGILSFFLGPLGILTVAAGLFFGIKGKTMGQPLEDKLGYQLSIGGLVLNGVVAAFLVLMILITGVLIGGSILTLHQL